jgi:hypothetical protein
VTGIRLLPAGPCSSSRGIRPHTWQPGDTADLIAYGQPDYAIACCLGRCRYCGTALLLLAPLAAEDSSAAALYETHGAEL